MRRTIEDGAQYSFCFDMEASPEYKPGREEKTFCGYDELRLIKVSDLYDSGLVERPLLNILAKNGKEFLVDFLRLSEAQILRLKGVGGRRADLLLDWKREVEMDPFPYSQFYKEIVGDRTFPEYNEIYERSTWDVLILFVRQYASFLERIGEGESAKILTSYMGFGCLPSSYKILGEKLGKTPERIRQLLQKVALDCGRLIHGESIRNIRASGRLKDAWKELKGGLYRPIPSYWIDMYFRAGSDEDTLLRLEHFLDFWGMDLLMDTSPSDEVFYVLIPKSGKGLYVECLSFLVSRLRQSPFWIRWDEISDWIEKAGMCEHEAVIRMIGCFHPCMERSLDDCFRLRWEYLNAVQTEARRILLDGKRAFSRNELLDAYNERALRSGKNPIMDRQLVISSDDYFRCQNRSGLWCYDAKGSQMVDVRVFISDYILSNEGVIRLESLIKAVADAGYLYSDQTVRAYVSIYCRCALSDRGLWVHKDCVARYPDIRLRKEMCFKNKRMGVVYHDLIEQRTISILKESASHQGRMSDLFVQCRDLVPPGKKLNVIYKIWKNSDLLHDFEGIDGKRWLGL